MHAAIRAGWKAYGADRDNFRSLFEPLPSEGVDAWFDRLQASPPEILTRTPRGVPHVPFVVVGLGDERAGQTPLADLINRKSGRRIWGLETIQEVSVAVFADDPQIVRALDIAVKAALLASQEGLMKTGRLDIEFDGAGPLEPAPDFQGEGGRGLWTRTQHWSARQLIEIPEVAIEQASEWWFVLGDDVLTKAEPGDAQPAPINPTDPRPPRRTLDPEGVPGGVTLK